MTVYNKLVRDKIPQIIEKSGEIPVIRVLEDEEYLACLKDKLREETEEFCKDQNLEELADILEVVYALADRLGSRDQLQEVFQRKHEARGGFEKRYYLIGKKEEGEK